MKFITAVLAVALAATANAAALGERGPGPVCIKPQVGCGTSLAPRCCDPCTPGKPVPYGCVCDNGALKCNN